MFTGLVQAKNHLISRTLLTSGARLRFSHGFIGLTLGESIAISGACLTVVQFDHEFMDVELSVETLKLTTLGALTPGASVNMERALLATDRLGGHLVSGHVDGVGEVNNLHSLGEVAKIVLSLPPELSRYVAKKGSLTVEGVSLTVNEVTEDTAELLIISHTLGATTLGGLKRGDRVNIEVDLISRYLERLLTARA